MPLLAHAGAPLAPHDLWGAWSLAPAVIVPLVVLAAVHLRGVRRRWAAVGAGAGISRGQVACSLAGIVAVAVALVSPLDALAGSLSSAHMAQHLLLTLVAAPLLLLGRVHTTLLDVVPLARRRRWARSVARRHRRAPVAWAVAAVGLYLLVLLAWHLPPLYDGAARIPVLHDAEHVTMLATALGFWAVVGAARPRPVGPLAIGAFVASVVSVLLAALMTAAAAPWYAAHLDTTGAFGLTPLQDQHLAAAILWVPGGLVHLGAVAAAVVRWLRDDERRLAARRRMELARPR